MPMLIKLTEARFRLRFDIPVSFPNWHHLNSWVFTIHHHHHPYICFLSDRFGGVVAFDGMRVFFERRVHFVAFEGISKVLRVYSEARTQKCLCLSMEIANSMTFPG